MKRNIPLFKIYWDEQDVNRIIGIIKKGMDWATGPNVREFENRLAEYVGTNYAVTFNSGTSALHAVLIAYNMGKEDEVIVPTFTFISTANAPLFVGAKPIFAEIEDTTYGLDPQDVKRKITSKTKAIIPIHYGGCSCYIKELKQIAQKNNLLLIEDAAESLGAMVDNKKVGSFGDAAMFSFCAPKVITTGEGGAIVTNSREIYEKLKLIRSHGRAETSDYFSTSEYLEYVTLGYNFRMSNILATLAIAQLEKIEKIIEMRRRKATYITQKLSQVDEVILPKAPDDFFHVYQMYTIKVNGGKIQRDALMKHLNQQGIGAKVYFYPVHLTHFYKKKFGYKGGELPITEKISNQVLTLPMYPHITEEEMDYIVEEIKNFFLRANSC